MIAKDVDQVLEDAEMCQHRERRRIWTEGVAYASRGKQGVSMVTAAEWRR